MAELSICKFNTQVIFEYALSFTSIYVIRPLTIRILLCIGMIGCSNQEWKPFWYLFVDTVSITIPCLDALVF